MAGTTERDESLRMIWRTITDLMFGPEQHDRIFRAAESVGLPHPGAVKALTMIDEVNPPSMRELAALLRCDASYITGLVDLLEAPGYVVRRTHPQDRRVKQLHLTAAGRRAKVKVRDLMAEPPEELDRLSDADVVALLRIAKKLAGRP